MSAKAAELLLEYLAVCYFSNFAVVAYTTVVEVVREDKYETP